MHKLGILDWGIGGFGLFQKLKSKAELGIVYFSDSGFTPYGKVLEDELKSRVEKVIHFLHSKGCTHVAIACNAAGSVVANPQHTNIVDQALNLIENSPKPLGIIGGKRVITSNIFNQNNQEDIVQVVAQKLSAHIEAGRQNSIEAERDLTEILDKVGPVKALLLACTHYPALKNKIETFLKSPVEILDPADLMSDHMLNNYAFQKFDDEIFTTGDGQQTIEGAKLAFNVLLTNVHEVDKQLQ